MVAWWLRWPAPHSAKPWFDPAKKQILLSLLGTKLFFSIDGAGGFIRLCANSCVVDLVGGLLRLGGESGWVSFCVSGAG